MLTDVSSLPKNSKILLHVCCGACLNASVNAFKDQSLSFYFYNPNIHPYSEYLRRREALFALSYLKDLDGKLFTGEYHPEFYFRLINGFETYPERCRFCYRLRLQETAQRAAEEGFKYFSTTIIASPYQLYDVALEEALRAAETFDLAFVQFKVEKKDYRKAVENFKKSGLYYQNYCGCLFSELERFGAGG